MKAQNKTTMRDTSLEAYESIQAATIPQTISGI